MFGLNKLNGEVTVLIDGMHCMHCAANVTKTINSVKGCSDTKVNLEAKSATFTANDANLSDIKKAINDAGFKFVKKA